MSEHFTAYTYHIISRGQVAVELPRENSYRIIARRGLDAKEWRHLLTVKCCHFLTAWHGETPEPADDRYCTNDATQIDVGYPGVLQNTRCEEHLGTVD